MEKQEENWEINHMNVARDSIKGLNKTKLQQKYNITEEQCDIILIFYKNFIVQNSKRRIDQIADIYENGMDIDVIAKKLDLDIKIVSYFAHRSLLIKELKKIAMNSLSDRKKLVHEGKCTIVADFWYSGGYETVLKENGISKTFLSNILEVGAPTYDFGEVKDFRPYKYIMAQAYDSGIITDDMLERVFEMDEKTIESFRMVDSDNILKFKSNKLYQIYKYPSLLDDFTFTNEEIEHKALEFKKRRASEELLDLQYRRIRNRVTI